MPEDDIKKLPPEERIKKLKELEAKKKKEIAEAEKAIQESQDEITDRRKWLDKVPIPEIGKEELEGLSAEGREILKVNKGLAPKAKPGEEELEKKDQKISALEEAIAQEKFTASPEQMGVQYGAGAVPPGGMDYKPLSKTSIPEMYQVVKNVNQAVEEKGYMNPQEERVFQYASSEIERRLEAAEEGRYTGFTEEIANAASVIQQMSLWRLRGYVERREHKYQWVL